MNALIQDFLFACRMLGRNRGFTFVVVLTLALGIGANTALFSLVNQVLLSPLPFKDPDRIVNLQSVIAQYDAVSAVSGDDYLDWRKRSTSVTELTVANMGARFIITGDGEPLCLNGWLVSPSFFSLFGVAPSHGRGLVPDDETLGNHRQLIITHGCWQRRFGGEPGVIGRKVTIEGQPYEIAGVMPPMLGFIEEATEVFAPFPVDWYKGARGNHHLQVFGRLAPGATLGQAQAEFSSIAQQLAEEYPDTNKGYGVRIAPLQEDMVRGVRTAFLVLYGVVGLVLLIVCVNVANLLLARSVNRSREIAIRLALGASRARVIRLLLTESVLLGLLGGALGLVFAYWGVDLLRGVSPKHGISSVPMMQEVNIDGRVLMFTACLSILTGLLFGLVPALHCSKPDVNETLKDSGRAGGGVQRHRFLGAFTTAEVALSLTLLAGAGLMIKSFYTAHMASPGFDPHNVLCIELDLPFYKYGDPQKIKQFYNQLIERVAALPGVQSVGLNNLLPMGGGNCGNGFEIEGRPKPSPGQWLVAEYRLVNANYFQSMRVPLKRGRAFSNQDDGQGTKVMVINETMARKFFPNEDPIGKRIRILGQDALEVVGIVGDEKFWGIMAEASPAMYQPYHQTCWNRMSLAIRTAVPPTSLSSAVQQSIWEVDKDQPVSRISTMQELVRNSVSVQRFVLALFCIFAAVALILATIGVYGVMAYSVNQRTHEIGVRMALGARAGDILLLFLKQGLARAGIGMAIGLVLAIIMATLMRTMLYEVSATDPLTLVVVSLVLAAAALLACLSPALKASRFDPMTALRYE